MTESDRVVIKIGGSLLARPGLPSALETMLDTAPSLATSRCRVLLVGGGAAVDALRAIDRANPLAESVTHWGAIDAMDANARLVASWLPRTSLTRDWRRLERASAGDWVFQPGDFLRRVEPRLPGRRLPIGWRVTSDSIAARVAELLRARLVLVKTTPPGDWRRLPPDRRWAVAADEGYVDRWLPRAIEGVPSVRVLALPAGGGGIAEFFGESG